MKLLRVVNSAYFGLSGQVSSVSQAVVILGFQQVRNLVLSVSMLSNFKAAGPRASEIQQKLWEVSFGTASAAQLIGRKKKIDAKDLELVFVGGLLQNIGALFMLSALGRSYCAVYDESEQKQTRLAEVESRRLSTNHAEVGSALMVKWRLPENLILLVGRHEGPFKGNILAPLGIVHIAERVAEQVLKGEPVTPASLGVDPGFITWLGFTDEDFKWLEDEVRVKMDAAMELIGNLKSGA